MGQLANGPGLGAGAIITAHEDHVFATAETAVSLIDGISNGRVTIPVTNTCSDGHGNGVMPYVPERDAMQRDRSWVRWRLKVVIKRKGLLKRDVK